MKLYFIFFFLILLNVNAQTSLDDSFSRLQKMIEKQFLENHKDFEKKFKDLEKNGQGALFKDLRDMMNGFGNSSLLRDNNIRNDIGSWKDLEKRRVLLLNIPINQKRPFDIKIKNGIVSIKGVLEKRVETQTAYGKSTSVQIQKIQQEFSIPDDVSQDNPQILSEKGKIAIYFQKLGVPKKSGRPALKKNSFDKSRSI